MNSGYIPELSRRVISQSCQQPPDIGVVIETARRFSFISQTLYVETFLGPLFFPFTSVNIPFIYV